MWSGGPPGRAPAPFGGETEPLDSEDELHLNYVGWLPGTVPELSTEPVGEVRVPLGDIVAPLDDGDERLEEGVWPPGEAVPGGEGF